MVFATVGREDCIVNFSRVKGCEVFWDGGVYSAMYCVAIDWYLWNTWRAEVFQVKNIGFMCEGGGITMAL